MTSCGRSYSQIPERTRFFVTMPDLTQRFAPYYYYSSIPMSERLVAVTVPYKRIGNVIETETVADMRTLYAGNGNGGVAGYGYVKLFDAGKTILLKDLGQTIDFKVKGLLAIQWRLVQIVSGPTTEGVPADYPAGGEGWVVTYIDESPSDFYAGEFVGVMRVG